jgi:predicted DNA-binding protein (UPF0251 family)
MPRPRLARKIDFDPTVTYFKPRGVPLSLLEIVSLSPEELEAIRLRHVLKLEQSEAAEHMKTSQSTFQRILCAALAKVAEALVKGKGIKIEVN